MRKWFLNINTGEVLKIPPGQHHLDFIKRHPDAFGFSQNEVDNPEDVFDAVSLVTNAGFLRICEESDELDIQYSTEINDDKVISELVPFLLAQKVPRHYTVVLDRGSGAWYTSKVSKFIDDFTPIKESVASLESLSSGLTKLLRLLEVGRQEPYVKTAQTFIDRQPQEPLPIKHAVVDHLVTALTDPEQNARALACAIMWGNAGSLKVTESSLDIYFANDVSAAKGRGSLKDARMLAYIKSSGPYKGFLGIDAQKNSVVVIYATPMLHDEISKHAIEATIAHELQHAYDYIVLGKTWKPTVGTAQFNVHRYMRMIAEARAFSRQIIHLVERYGMMECQRVILREEHNEQIAKAMITFMRTLASKEKTEAIADNTELAALTGLIHSIFKMFAAKNFNWQESTSLAAAHEPDGEILSETIRKTANKDEW